MYLGNFTEDTTNAGGLFTTRNTTGEAAALSSGLIDVYKLGSTTPTTAGATLTSSFAEVTGLNQLQIDLSSTTFYATGEEYAVVMSQGEVNSVDVTGETIFQFSIENRYRTITSTDVDDSLGTYGASTWTSTEVTDVLGTYGVSTMTTDTVADAIWDETLTGGNHNDPTSAGRRLRSIGDYSVYEGGAVWYDDVNGTAGTVDFENGTVIVPSDEEASVTTLLASLGLTTVHCNPGSTYVLEATYANKVFIGDNWTLDLNGQSVVGCVFIGATVTGVMAGTGTTQQFINCLIGATSLIKGTHLIGSGLSGTLTVAEAGEFFIDNCHSAVAGAGSVTFDFGAALNSSNLNVRHHSGGWTVANMGAGTGTYNASFEGNGQIVWAASCSATSNASIRGNWKITDNASGAVTETLDDNQTSVDAILNDTAELQTDWADGGRLDVILDGASTHTSTDVFDQAKNAISTLGVSTHTSTDVFDQSKNAISTLGVSTHTSTDIFDQSKNAISSLGVSTVSSAVQLTIATTALETHGASTHTAAEVMTNAMTEAYTTGATPTPAEWMFEMKSFLQNFVISSTTYTGHTIGSTTVSAATWELTSTAPVGIRRTG